jgi:hypothetical protein
MTPTKRITTTIISSILAVILCVTLCGMSFLNSIDLFLGGCLWWECAPDRSFDVLDLGLPSQLFPANTIYSPIHSSDDDNAETYRTGTQTFRWGNGGGGGIHIVDMYSSSRNSSARFKSNKKSFFKDWGEQKFFGPNQKS